MKIEAGKYYRSRRGDRHGPITRIGDGLYPWAGPADGTSYHTWTEHGAWLTYGGSTEHDLVAEWIDPIRTTVAPSLDFADGYESLATVLQAAHDQAATGKGRARHSSGQPFDKQPIMEIGRMVGPGYQTGQAMKKAQEATRMFERGQHASARAELLGAINYLAAAVMLIDERPTPSPTP